MCCQLKAAPRARPDARCYHSYESFFTCTPHAMSLYEYICQSHCIRMHVQKSFIQLRAVTARSHEVVLAFHNSDAWRINEETFCMHEGCTRQILWDKMNSTEGFFYMGFCEFPKLAIATWHKAAWLVHHCWIRLWSRYVSCSCCRQSWPDGRCPHFGTLVWCWSYNLQKQSDICKNCVRWLFFAPSPSCSQ